MSLMLTADPLLYICAISVSDLLHETSDMRRRLRVMDSRFRKLSDDRYVSEDKFDLIEPMSCHKVSQRSQCDVLTLYLIKEVYAFRHWRQLSATREIFYKL